MIGGRGSRLTKGEGRYWRDIRESYSSPMGVGSVWVGGFVGMGIKHPRIS